MRICYLADASSIHTIRWVRFFAEKGHDVHVISFEKAQIKGVNVHVLKLPILVKNATFPLKVASIYTMKKMIKRIKPDILHAHYLTNYGFFGALCNFHPFIATAWGSDVLTVKTESPLIRWIKKFITTYVARKTDIITADSKSLMKVIIKLGAPLEKIKLVSHGVSINEFNPHKKSLKFREKLGIPPDSKVIISTRGLEPLYNIELLVKAISHVIKIRSNVHFLILGDGTQKRRLREMANHLTIEKYVSFIGKVPHEKVAEFLANSDVYVSTALSDSTSVSLLEAMASQLPVIVTDLEGNREWIKNGVNGFIIPTTNPKTLAEKILQLLDNEETARKFGTHNRKVVEEKANYEEEMTKVEEIYKHLTAKHQSKKTTP